MTNRELIDRILRYYPPMDFSESCDGYKYGDADQTCTGIVTTCVPTVEVIRQTAAIGSNFIYCHEPLFWDHMDDPNRLTGNEVLAEKKRLLDEHHITVFRDHDRMHAENGKTDWIVAGWEDLFGWSSGRLETPEGCIGQVYQVEPTTLEELARRIKSALSLNGVRILGKRNQPIQKVWMCVHILPNPIFDNDGIISAMMREDIDVLIPLDTVDWTTLSFVRDATMLGYHKAAIMPGHFNVEEAGMQYLAHYLAKELNIEGMPVTHIPSRAMYDYVL